MGASDWYLVEHTAPDTGSRMRCWVKVRGSIVSMKTSWYAADHRQVRNSASANDISKLGAIPYDIEGRGYLVRDERFAAWLERNNARIIKKGG